MILDDVGVVAIGRNEGERLIACLASINRNTGTIVYVDSGSTDQSISEAQRAGACVVELDMGTPFTAARARNEGFDALVSLKPSIRFVQFVDGDCTLVDGWLAAAHEFIDQRKDVAIVCGRRREQAPAASIYNRLCDIEWNTPIGETTACGGDSLMRVEALRAVGGFRAQLIAGEEPELCVRLREIGWKIWRLDKEMTRHDAAITRLRQWWIRSVRCGFGMTEVSLLHKTSRFRIFKRETARAVIWGAGIPVAISLGTLFHPAALLGLIAYPLQVCRVALNRDVSSWESWAYAFFMMLAKFAELQGALRFYWRRWCGHAVQLIEYK